MKITKKQLAALIAYIGDKDSRNDVKRLTAKVEARQQGLTDNSDELLTYFRQMVESLAHLAQAGMEPRQIVNTALTLFEQPACDANSISDLYRKIQLR